jgi:uncharacterized membrane protein required for colicin V production
LHLNANVIDLAVYGIILISVAAGFYQGFLASAINTAGYFIAMFCASLFYGGAAMNVKVGGKIISQLLYYSETSGMLGSVDVSRTSVNGISQLQLDSLLKSVHLPFPLDRWFSHNVLGAVYAQDGISTLGDYLSHTVAETAVNIACFLAILLGVYIAVTLIVNLIHYVVKLPAVKLFDGLLGGVVGLGRGVLLAFALFLIVPVVLSILPVKQIQDLISSSHTAAFFYQKNFMFNMIKSFIG